MAVIITPGLVFVKSLISNSLPNSSHIAMIGNSKQSINRLLTISWSGSLPMIRYTPDGDHMIIIRCVVTAHLALHHDNHFVHGVDVFAVVAHILRQTLHYMSPHIST